jgi:hypothetical protein
MAEKEGKEEAPKVATDYDATEHLMSVDEVSAKYAVKINKEQPGKSPGLSGSEVRFINSILFNTLGSTSVEISCMHLMTARIVQQNDGTILAGSQPSG